MGFEAQKEDVGQTLGAYGVTSGCYFVLPVFGPTTVRDSIGLVADTFVDPFAHITWRENELFGVSGSQIDYLSVKGTTTIDFRADNMTNFTSLEKILSIYMHHLKVYIYKTEKEKLIIPQKVMTNGEV